MLIDLRPRLRCHRGQDCRPRYSFMLRFPQGLNYLHRGIVGMTLEATCRKDQFVITAPEAIAIAYPRSESVMQNDQVILFHEPNSELLEQRNPRQKIAYGVIHLLSDASGIINRTASI